MRIRIKELIDEKAAREGRAINQSTMAKESGIQAGTVSRYMKGWTTSLDMGVLEKLLDYFECDYNALFERIPGRQD